MNPFSSSCAPFAHFSNYLLPNLGDCPQDKRGSFGITLAYYCGWFPEPRWMPYRLPPTSSPNAFQVAETAVQIACEVPHCPPQAGKINTAITNAPNIATGSVGSVWLMAPTDLALPKKVARCRFGTVSSSSCLNSRSTRSDSPIRFCVHKTLHSIP